MATRDDLRPHAAASAQDGGDKDKSNKAAGHVVLLGDIYVLPDGVVQRKEIF